MEVLHRAVEWGGTQGPKLDPGLGFTSDASGLWGCGASYGNQWFQYPWDAKAPAYSSERAGPNSDGCSGVGSQLERLLRLMLL